MNDFDEISALAQGMFVLGVIYENRLQHKYGSDKLTEEELIQMEEQVDSLAQQLPPHLRKILEDRKINSNMGLITGIY